MIQIRFLASAITGGLFLGGANLGLALALHLSGQDAGWIGLFAGVSFALGIILGAWVTEALIMGRK